jgi:hypothetical protein
MGRRAEDAGDGEAEAILALTGDEQLTLAAIALQLEQVARQGENADHTEHAGAAMGAAVGNEGLGRVQNHGFNHLLQRDEILPAYEGLWPNDTAGSGTGRGSAHG